MISSLCDNFKISAQDSSIKINHFSECQSATAFVKQVGPWDNKASEITKEKLVVTNAIGE